MFVCILTRKEENLDTISLKHTAHLASHKYTLTSLIALSIGSGLGARSYCVRNGATFDTVQLNLPVYCFRGGYQHLQRSCRTPPKYTNYWTLDESTILLNLVVGGWWLGVFYHSSKHSDQNIQIKIFRSKFNLRKCTI